MKAFKTLGILSAVLTVGLTAANPVAAAELCQVVKSCNNGCYTFASRTADVVSEPYPTEEGGYCLDSADDDYISFKVPLSWAPVPATLDCAGGLGTQSCEGWPQGESVTYSWSTTGTLQISGGTPANPFRSFTCTRGTTGTITLTAYGPQGAASSVTTSVTCP